MNEIFSNDVTSSESNWKNTPQSLKVWKKHPRPSSKLFVSSKNHISKSANVSMTISSYIMYIIFRVLQSTSPNFEPSIWDSFSATDCANCTYFCCTTMIRALVSKGISSSSVDHPWRVDNRLNVEILEDRHAATGAPWRLSDCACAWYTLRGSLERTCHCWNVWPVWWSWWLQVSETRKTCAAHVTSKWINGWCFFCMSWSRASQYLIRKEHGDLHLKCNKELLPIVSN